MISGVAILGLDRIRVGRSLQNGGVKDIAPGGDEQPFGETASAPLFDQLDQAGGLQRAQMMPDVLTRQAELLGQTGGGGRLGEGGEDAAADRGQRQEGGVQVVEQG